METTIKAISEVGILIVIAGLYLWTTYSDKLENKKTLVLLAESNNNIAKSLELLKETMNNQDTILRTHDERSIMIKEDIIEVKTLLHQCSDRLKVGKHESKKITK